MDKKIGHPKAARNAPHNFTGNDTHSQCMRLLNALRENPITTIEARRDLDILMPAARVFDLKALGHAINTVWTSAITVDNRKHRVARYVLVREAGHE